jgi:hypothetical protein
MCERAKAVALELAKGKLRIEPGKASLVATRNEVRRAWLAVGDIPIRQQQPELAAQVRRFSKAMPPSQTEKKWLAGDWMRVRATHALAKARLIEIVLCLAVRSGRCNRFGRQCRHIKKRNPG